MRLCRDSVENDTTVISISGFTLLLLLLFLFYVTLLLCFYTIILLLCDKAEGRKKGRKMLYTIAFLISTNLKVNNQYKSTVWIS